MKKILLSFFLSLAVFLGLQAQGYIYEKVTTAPVDWSGDYLIVYEAGSLAFDGSLAKLDASKNTIGVTISDGTIAVNDAADAAKFTIEASGGGYTIKSASGYYIGQTSNANGLASNESTTYVNTLSLNTDATVNVVSGGAYLRYNATSGQERFRYYKSTTYTSQKAITFYKRVPVGDDVVVAPSLPASCEFVGSMKVTISNNSDGATVYYSTDGMTYVEGTSLTINETTTVYAYAQKGDKQTDPVSVTYTRVAAAPQILYSGDSEAFDGSIEVTLTAENATCYYTLNGKEPTSESTVYTGALVIKADATLMVIAIDDDGYESAVVEETFKRKAIGGESTASLVSAVTELSVGNKVVIVASGYDYALSTTQNSNNRGQVAVTKGDGVVTLNDNVQILTLENGTKSGTFAFNTGAAGYLYAASASKNYLRTQTDLTDNSSWTISIESDGVATVVAQGTNTNNTMRYNASNGLFSCYAEVNTQKPLSIYKLASESISAYTLTVGSLGWSTLYLDYDAVVPEGVEAYIVTEVTGDVATLTLVDGVIPANTAVVIKAAQGKYDFAVSSQAAAALENSMMSGTTKPMYIDSEAYVLSAPGDVVGLYKAEMNGGVFLNNANKAYLPASAVASLSNNFSFRFEDGITTGIDNVETEENSEVVVYDLTGRRVQDMSAPGVYIVNGRKVLVK